MNIRLKCISILLAIATAVLVTTACGNKITEQTSNAVLENELDSVCTYNKETENDDSIAIAASQNLDESASEKPSDNDLSTKTGKQVITYDIDQNNKDTLKRAGLIVTCDANEFLSNFSQGDLVSVEFDTGEVLKMPVCGSYDDVSPGEVLIKANPDDTKFTMATNYGELALELGFMELSPENSEFAYQIIESRFPHTVTVRLLEKGTYLNRIALGKMSLSKLREDYHNLSDEEFANFRNIACGSIVPGILYRSSSPIDDEIGRTNQADAAMKANGIKSVINMADSEEEAKKMPGYGDTYYSNCNVLFKKMSMSFGTDDFNRDIADALRFIADNEGPYLIHCVYGKDRTGLLCAILESLCDAEMNEIQSEYLKTYELLYDIKDGHQEPISSENKQLISDTIIENLSYAYGIDVTESNHHQKTIEFLLSIGLSSSDIERIQSRLCDAYEMEKAA